MNKICIYSIIKDERDYIDEWIRHHINLGMDKIFIYEDINSVSHKDITDKYDKVELNSILSLYEGEERNQILLNSYQDVFQQLMYVRKALTHIKNSYDFDWCLVIDSDEFIVVDENKNIHDILSQFTDYDLILAQLQNYGANGLIHKPKYDKPIFDIFTEKKPYFKLDTQNQAFTKIFYNLHRFDESLVQGVHKTLVGKWCKTDFSNDLDKAVFKDLYIKHFITKSWEEYIYKICVRGDILKNNRKIEEFFEVNEDMLPMKDELYLMIDDIKEKYTNRSKNKNKGLIFDIGCFTGDDTKKFLSQGNKVIAVDANPYCINVVKNNFKDEIDNGQLEIIEGAIGNTEKTILYISNMTMWTSTHKEIANRNNTQYNEVEVKCLNAKELMEKYGEPYYCKIDIEQDDIVVLKQIENSFHPKYISCETECIGNRDIKKGEDMAVIDQLYNMGYDKFCLVDQRTHNIIGTDYVMKDAFPEFINDKCWCDYNVVKDFITNFDRSKLINKWNFWVDVFATN